MLSMTIEELKKLMRISADASKERIMQTFDRIAEVLMNGCVIKSQNEEYRILDFVLGTLKPCAGILTILAELI